MKKPSIMILIICILAITAGLSFSIADEVVLCVSEESQYAVLMDSKGQCIEGESEFVTSGNKIKRLDDALLIAVFAENENCEVGSHGTTTQIGFDKNDDGVLSGDDILTTSGSCSSLGDQEDIASE